LSPFFENILETGFVKVATSVVTEVRPGISIDQLPPGVNFESFHESGLVGSNMLSHSESSETLYCENAGGLTCQVILEHVMITNRELFCQNLQVFLSGVKIYIFDTFCIVFFYKNQTIDE
jgi:hypothetical protein